MFPISEVSDVQLAFPANVLDMMPKYKDIPEEFKDSWNPYAEFTSVWFFRGVEGVNFYPRSGVDKDKALRHIQAVLRSFEPKHEHKEAAVAFLLHEWFEKICYDGKVIT